MNVFYLDDYFKLAAQYHCDVHVVSQPKEAGQILSTACYRLGIWHDGLYRPTHINGPYMVWASTSIQNAEWLLHLAFELGQEFTRRRKARGKQAMEHRSIDVCCEAFLTMTAKKHRKIIDALVDDFTPPPQAGVPAQYRGDDTVEAYRRYYRCEKRSLLNSKRELVPAKWTIHGPPPWWDDQPEEVGRYDDIFADETF